MESLAQYFQMGGYAAFVWPAYGLGLIGLVGVLWLSLKSWKDAEQEFSGLKSSRDDGASS